MKNKERLIILENKIDDFNKRFERESKDIWKMYSEICDKMKKPKTLKELFPNK